VTKHQADRLARALVNLGLESFPARNEPGNHFVFVEVFRHKHRFRISREMLGREAAPQRWRADEESGRPEGVWIENFDLHEFVKRLRELVSRRILEGS
jgi:hypothetical protein